MSAEGPDRGGARARSAPRHASAPDFAGGSGTRLAGCGAVPGHPRRCPRLPPPQRPPPPPPSYNQLTSSLPPEWGALARLQDLELAGNQLTGGVPPEWQGMRGLQRLYLA